MKDIVFKTLMVKGESGSSIASIEKTATVGSTDTYTITFTDDTPATTFTVQNGTSIATVEKTATVGLVDTYTITLTDGSTTTFEVTNGQDASYYELPADSVVGFDVDSESLSVPSGYEEILSPYDSSLDTESDNAVQNQAVANEIAFHAGSSYSVTNFWTSGTITGSGTYLFFSIPLPKTIGADVSSVSGSGFTAVIRQAGNYVGGTSGSQALDLETICDSEITWSIQGSTIECSASATTALANAINNDICSLKIVSGTITFA